MLMIVLKILPLTTSHNIIQPHKYMIENNTILWPQNISYIRELPLLIQNNSSPATNKSFICHCSTTGEQIGIEVSGFKFLVIVKLYLLSNMKLKVETECHCGGLKLLRIPQNLFSTIQRLTVASAGLKILKGAGLNNYSSTLRDM